ncbi:MAG: DNA-binding protein [Clostridia bacterium]|nr:DNA-binding protein [Clostridia bacterium]
MDRIFELGKLLDMYGALLTDRQRSVVDQYANENCSLAEIAEREEISRQAVRDLLVRAEHTLHSYEDRLHLCEKAAQQRSIVGAMARRFHDVSLAPAERDAFDAFLLTLTEIWED